MTILKELCVPAGEYQSNGQTKTKWVRIGHLHKTQDGKKQYITLDPMYNLAAFPLKDDDDRLYVNLFDPKPRDGKPAPKQEAMGHQGGGMDPEGDIPFAPLRRNEL